MFNWDIFLRLVKNLFELARKHKPSIIFFDQIHSLSSSYDESKLHRCIKTEFLCQMKDVGNDMDGILVIGATYMPWLVDSSILSCFEKRIYIPLPKEQAILDVFKLCIRNTPHTLSEDDLEILVKKSAGWDSKLEYFSKYPSDIFKKVAWAKFHNGGKKNGISLALERATTCSHNRRYYQVHFLTQLVKMGQRDGRYLYNTTY